MNRPLYPPRKQKSLSKWKGFFCTQSRGRTGTTVKLLVFETNASTNSAIWASGKSNLKIPRAGVEPKWFQWPYGCDWDANLDKLC